MGDLAMKKITALLIIASFAFVAMVSCSKEEMANPNDPAEQQKQPGQETPGQEQPGEDPVIPEGMILLNFSCSSENDAPADQADETKTSWDGSTHAWSEGDQIRIIWGEGDVEGTDYAIAEVVDGQVSAVVADADYYYAVYPATATYTYTAAEGKISVKFERGQSGSFSDANIMAAKTSKAAASFNFKNMTGIIKFTLAAESPYGSINFSANDKTVLNGWVDTTFPDTFAVTTRAGANTGKDAYNNSQYNNMLSVSGLSAGGTYYVAVLPDVTLSNGIGFNVYKSGSQSTGALSTGALTIARSKVKALPVIDNQIHESWFITEDGTGKGTSWDDAGGPERLVQLIYPDQARGAGAGLTAAWRLHKATIYVAAGTYNIQAANGDEVLAPHYNTETLTTATIKGGYPTGLTGTATTGYDPENNATEFICNETATTDHIFAVSGTNRVNNFTFQGITFTANPSATETNIDGIALSFSSSVASTLTFKDCYFTSLTGSTGTSNYNGGSAINVNSSADAAIHFEDCTFSNNTAARGGVAALRNTGAGSDISFTGCTFTDNIASSNQGGSIYIYANGSPIVFDNTSFSGDGSTKNANNGGAVAIMKNASATLQNGCSFTDLSASSGSGGAIFNHGTLVADGTTFSRCIAAYGGAIHTDGYATIGETAACSFENNVASSTGGAIRFQKTNLGADSPTFSVSNSSFSGNATDANAVNGGGIAAVSGYEYTVSNCSFSNLLATLGGAIYNQTATATIEDTCTFTGNDATTSGGAIYNNADGTITVDGGTITGKGKGTSYYLSVVTGGGIYNTGTATLQNGTIVQNCSISSHSSTGYGAGIWNNGTLNISGNCEIKNNYCAYRGAGFHNEADTGIATIRNTTFSGNECANGSAVNCMAGSETFIEGCTFTNNTATNGAAIRTTGGSSSAIAKVKVFNTLIEGNTSGSSTNAQNNGTVQIAGYGVALFANCTIRNNTTPGSTAALTVNGSNGKIYAVSCTMSENGADITRGSSYLEVHNSILMDGADNPSKVVIEKSYWYGHLYGASRSDKTDGVEFSLNSFDSAKGVYPLNSTYSSIYTQGMSVAELQAMSFSNLSLNSEQLSLLAKDQKGNPRVVNDVDNKIMGAYVLTE